MAYPTTPRLDNLAAMQSRPLGTNTALYRDPTTEALTRQYRQQKSDYGMARRLLRREARRGNADSAMKLISLGKDASKEGVQFGMEGRDQMGAAVARQRSTMEKGATGMGLAAGRLREATAPAGGASASTAPASTASAAPASTASAAPASTASAAPASTAPAPVEPSSRRPVNLPESATGSAIYDTREGRETFDTDLGQRAAYAAQRLGGYKVGSDKPELDFEKEKDYANQVVKFRQGLDRALGMARTQKEVDELEVIARNNGIKPEAFKHRTLWWNKNRK